MGTDESTLLWNPSASSESSAVHAFGILETLHSSFVIWHPVSCNGTVMIVSVSQSSGLRTPMPGFFITCV